MLLSLPINSRTKCAIVCIINKINALLLVFQTNLCDFNCGRTMKRQLLLALMMGIFLLAAGQEKNIYDPDADPQKDIEQAIAKAVDHNRHVLLMIGGNWCPWCRRLHAFINDNDQVSEMLKNHYELVMVNYSKENENRATLARYGYPQRFGFPVLVVLDANGERIHTQSTVCLEEGKGYSQKRIVEFLKNWRPEAIDPSSYKQAD